jgi:hypothetical protein
MEFRWVVVITLWTMLIGPILGTPSGSTSARHAPVKPGQVVPVSAPAQPR